MKIRELSTESGARKNAEIIREYWAEFGVNVIVQVVRATDQRGGRDPVYGIRSKFPGGNPPDVKMKR